MSEELYRAVLAAPDRNGPRRRYAEYLERGGDELGEYIRLAIDWDRRRLTTHARVARAAELHTKLRDRQAAPVAPWTRLHQRDRGLVAMVEMDGRTFLEHADDVFAVAPIQHLDLVETKSMFAEIAGSPLLARVQSLRLSENDLGDAEAGLLAASPHVRRLLYLDLGSNRIGEAGLDAIAASSTLVALRQLHFGRNLVESPVDKWSSDGVSGLVFYAGTGPLQAVLERKYGTKAWMHPSEGDVNVDRYALCDAGE